MNRNYPTGLGDPIDYMRRKKAMEGASQDLIDLDGGDMALMSGMDAVAADSAGIQTASAGMGGLGDAAMSSGNPYAMAAGAGIKAATLGLDLYNAHKADAEAERDKQRQERIENEKLAQARQRFRSGTTDKNMSRVMDWSNFNEGQGPNAEELAYFRRQRA